MRLLPPMVALLALLPLLGMPAAAAPAAELEVVLLDDERADLVVATGGHDLTRLALVEAHLPEVGVGSAGDGVSFRATLRGESSHPLGGVLRLVLSFDAPAGRAERWLETSDGATFTHDFDALSIQRTAEGLEVQRAFVAYASLGVAPGATLSNFRLASFTDGEPRDVAPGGIHLPGPLGGAFELPMGPSRVVQAEHVLAGVGGYAAVSVAEESVGVFVITVRSLLQQDAQQVLLGIAAPQAGWTFDPLSETGATLPPGGERTFRVRLYADAPPAALRLDVLTDAGGRVGLVAENLGNVLTLRVDDERVDVARAPMDRPVPAPVLVLALGAVGAAALLRRRAP